MADSVQVHQLVVEVLSEGQKKAREVQLVVEVLYSDPIEPDPESQPEVRPVVFVVT